MKKLILLKKNNKKAMIFGVTGQDGFYLSKFLLELGYVVHGIVRRSSSFNRKRIENLYLNNTLSKNFFLHYGDLIDSSSISRLISKIKPNEVYNLAAQSHVKISFDIPEYTTLVNANGTLNILEAIRGIGSNIKFYQAGTSEMFGASPPPQNELTNFMPRSPYAISKLYAHWITINYRESYGIFACNGILFNHESPLRGENFVTQKIVHGLIEIKKNSNKKLVLGNLYSKRDWGHAEDYVRAMWLMLQKPKSDDYVISTGKQYTVKRFIEKVALKLNMKIKWKGKGLSEKGYYNDSLIIYVDKTFFRPTEVESLLGDPTKAIKKLKWKPNYDLDSLIEDMISNYKKI